MCDVIGSIVYDLTNVVRSFLAWDKDTGALHLGVLEHAPEYKAADGEDSSFDFGVVVLLDFALLCGKSGESLGYFLVD